MDFILGIESSCDDTGVAIVCDGRDIKANLVASQEKEQSLYGGVVPELAAREHLKALDVILIKALNRAGISLSDIDAIAVTAGPGLIPALLVGLNFAKGLALSMDVPIIGVDHFLAHVYGAFLECGFDRLYNRECYPILALVVSGGHTALILLEAMGKIRLIGTTIDDAAGEALDKGAKMLGLGYPGGPILDSLAKGGDRERFRFPRSLIGASGKAVKKENEFNLSFSGLKTSLLYHIKNNGGVEALKDSGIFEDTIASYQYAVVDVLRIKVDRAIDRFKAKSVIVCGGVAQNTMLREELQNRFYNKVDLILTPKSYCGDNGAMIAGLGWHYFNRGEFSDISFLDAYSQLPNKLKFPVFL